MDMIFLMTENTSNSIESLLKIPFHIFMFQWNLLKEKLQKEYNASNSTTLSVG
jgi:hypothetical protein